VPSNRLLLFEFFLFVKTTIIAPKIKNGPLKKKMQNFSVLSLTAELKTNIT
jgi:hypothetical protein